MAEENGIVQSGSSELDRTLKSRNELRDRLEREYLDREVVGEIRTGEGRNFAKP